MHNVAWSAAGLLTHPDLVRQLHREYIDAGAQIIITNTFSTCRNIMDQAGLGDQVRQVNTLAVELAREARELAAADQVLIAGSISSMAPGNDRTRMPAGDQALANYREQAYVLAEAGADLIVLEMMRDLEHTGYALDAALSTGLPVWVGFSCKMGDNGSTVLLLGFRGDSDITLTQGLESVLEKGAELVAIMHTLTGDTTPALKEVLQLWRRPVGVYPHSGRFTMPNWQFQDIISPNDFLSKAWEWVELGVQVVGGCCGIGPEHIKVLKEGLPSSVPKPGTH